MNPVRRLPLVFILIFAIGAFPRVVGASEASLAITYGPTQSVQFAVNLGKLGVYLQPIIDYSSNDYRTDLEWGGRVGVQAGYTAFTYRRLEARLMGGSGLHIVVRRTEIQDRGGAVEFEERQTASEWWMQPEFRFYERFGIVLQAQVVRYLFESGDSLNDRKTFSFDTPDLSLSELRIGLRYYLPLRH